jgi:maltokinase
MNPDDLARWLPEQRWFAGRDRQIVDVRVGEIGTLLEEPLVRVHVVTVGYADGGEERYQVPAVYRDRPLPELGAALIGGEPSDDLPVLAYDAAQDPEAAAAFWAGIRGSRRFPGLEFHGEEAVTGLAPVLVSRMMPAEASNTSIVFGEAVMLKIFRRLTPGLSPDVELSRALQQAGNPYVPAVLGWLDGSWHDPDGSGASAALAIATEFLSSASGAWDLALTSLRSFLAESGKSPADSGADFGMESYRLGEAVAAIHSDLAQALGTGQASAASIAASLTKRLTIAAREANVLAPFVVAIEERYEAMASEDSTVQTQRIHGDLHLGQVLRVPAGWRILDFEGEPGTPIEERRAFGSPLRDVAGMLRSFDYVADALLGPLGDADPVTVERARTWVAHNQLSFASGHAAQGGPSGALVLASFVLDKAVYEVVYESRFRPEMVAGPLASIERMLAAVTPPPDDSA